MTDALVLDSAAEQWPTAAAVALALANDLRILEDTVAALGDVPVPSTAAEYEALTEVRASVRAKKDEIIEFRQAAVRPWKGVTNAIEAAVRPHVKACDAIDFDFAGKLAAYQRARLEADRAAQAAAQAAAKADDSPALLQALEASTALAARPTGGAVRTRWVVQSVDPGALPAEWWCPNREALDRYADAHRGDDPPVVPGVTFRQDVSVANRRNR